MGWAGVRETLNLIEGFLFCVYVCAVIGDWVESDSLMLEERSAIMGGRNPDLNSQCQWWSTQWLRHGNFCIGGCSKFLPHAPTGHL